MKKNWWNSLRIKIIAWSFVPTVIILSAVAWFTFYSYQKVIGDLAMKENLAVLDTKIVQAADGINKLINTPLVPIILNIDTKPELAPDVRAQNILDQASNLDVFDGGIYFVDKDGIVFNSQPEQPELIGQDWSNTSQFRSVRDNPPGSGPVTNIQTIGANNAKDVCVIWPMHNSMSEFIGAGYYCLAITPGEQNNLYKTVLSLSLGENVYILDGNQRIVFSPDLTQLGRDLSKEAFIQQLYQSGSRSIRFHNGSDDRVISYGTLIRNKDPYSSWILVYEQTWAEVMRPSLPYRQLLYGLLALGVIVPVLVTAYGVRHITNPIQKLIHASEQVTAGLFKHRIEVKTGDEIETLADQFNMMSAELDESYASLEKKVADRTRELAIMNSILSVASRSLDIQEILENALNITMEQMDFTAGLAFKFDIETKRSTLAAARGFEDTTVPDLINLVEAATTGKQANEQISVDTIEVSQINDEKLYYALSQSNVHTIVSVPLPAKGRNLGILLLGKPDPRPLAPEQLTLLSSIGQQLGVAIENAHLYEQAEQTAITSERNRLARELHDAVTQTLFSANLIADVIPRIWKRDPEEGIKNLEELRQLTRGALAEMRTMLLEMRPETLERVDIKSLLSQLADAFIGRVRVPVSLDVQGDCAPTQEVKLVFYRVAQEAMNNVAKHAGARQVDLHLVCQPGQLSMLIKDDGLGFDPRIITPEHLGIAIMRERANSIGANLKIESQVGQGTIVELIWKPGGEVKTNE